jgi:hypothetical protein
MIKNVTQAGDLSIHDERRARRRFNKRKLRKRKPFFKDIDLAPGKQRLGRVAAMLSRF